MFTGACKKNNGKWTGSWLPVIKRVKSTDIFYSIGTPLCSAFSIPIQKICHLRGIGDFRGNNSAIFTSSLNGCRLLKEIICSKRMSKFFTLRVDVRVPSSTETNRVTKVVPLVKLNGGNNGCCCCIVVLRPR